MTYVVTDNCIKCRYTDCVEVCPVDCFHGGPNMLVIDPEACIDCGVCEPECPVGAIRPEEPGLIAWMELNKKYSKEWPSITESSDPFPDAATHDGEEDKLGKYGVMS